MLPTHTEAAGRCVNALKRGDPVALPYAGGRCA